MTGAEMIAAERATHSERGFTLEHDLAHVPGELVAAAIAFIHGNSGLLPWGDGCGSTPAGRAHNLVIAGSLIAAELDCMAARGQIQLEPSLRQSAAWLATAECPFDCSVCRTGEDE